MLKGSHDVHRWSPFWREWNAVVHVNINKKKGNAVVIPGYFVYKPGHGAVENYPLTQSLPPYNPYYIPEHAPLPLEPHDPIDQEPHESVIESSTIIPDKVNTKQRQSLLLGGDNFIRIFRIGSEWDKCNCHGNHS